MGERRHPELSTAKLNFYGARRLERLEEGSGARGGLLLPVYRYFAVPASPVAPPPNPLWLFQESCAFKAATGVVLGGGVGVMMGLFFGILGADPAVPVGPGGRAIPSAPLRAQVRVAWRALGDKAVWYAKSFAVITALFSGCDCLFEKGRGKHDVVNGGLSGCATGAVLAAKQGPQAAAIGCAGFAAFSVAIDAVMHASE